MNQKEEVYRNEEECEYGKHLLVNFIFTSQTIHLSVTLLDTPKSISTCSVQKLPAREQFGSGYFHKVCFFFFLSFLFKETNIHLQHIISSIAHKYVWAPAPRPRTLGLFKQTLAYRLALTPRKLRRRKNTHTTHRQFLATHYKRKYVLRAFMNVWVHLRHGCQQIRHRKTFTGAVWASPGPP